MNNKPLFQYLETLRRITVELGPQRSFQSSLRFLLHTLAERHSFLRPHLVIFDPESHALRLCLATTPPAAEGVVYEPGVGITGQVFTLGRPVIVERISQNTVFQNKFFTRSAEEMHSLAFLSVPVLGLSEEPAEGLEVLGVLSMDTPVAPRSELEEQCRFLEVIAGIVANQVGYWRQESRRKQWDMGMAHDKAAGNAEPDAVAVSKAMRHVLARAAQAAASPVIPLLRGEAGTGKAFVAAIIHRMSPRKDMPLLYFDCTSHEVAALEGELFGVQKGAQPYTLQTRKGILERAHLGTLCVQNLDSLPIVLQRKMLRAMHEGRIQRVGGSGDVQINVRFICSSRRTVEDLRHYSLLDSDMLLHFSAWTVDIAPLRERAEDILPLAEHFLRLEAQSQGKDIGSISRNTAELLLRYAWPGNTHELKSCMHRAVKACDGESLRSHHLPPSLQGGEAGEKEPMPFADAVAAFEQSLLVDALRKSGGNMLEASRILDTSYRVVNYKVKKYALEPKDYA